MASPAKNIRREPPGPARQAEPLDAVDRQIIDALVADARITNRDLADAVGIAPSTALMRTRSLMERGAIEGFDDRDQIDTFTSRVPQLPEVLSTFHTSGSVDYLLHIAVRDTDALRDWVLDNLTTDPVVGHTETTLVFKHIPGHAGPLD